MLWFESTIRTAGIEHIIDDSGIFSMMDIYHVLGDGRIMELRFGNHSDSDGAIWARKLTAWETETYLRLKGQGYSDTEIYDHFQHKKAKAS